MTQNVSSVPLLTQDYDGRTDDRVWIMREKVLEDAVRDLTVERDFLREVLRTLLQEKANA
jgi:hypothetical protein